MEGASEGASEGAAEGAAEGASEGAMRSALGSLGVWSAAGEAIGQHASIADAFCALLSRKLSYGPQERDACLLEHTLRVEFPQRPNSPQRPTQIISSSLVAFGAPRRACCALMALLMSAYIRYWPVIACLIRIPH